MIVFNNIPTHWEWQPFDSVIADISRRSNKLKKRDYRSQGKYPAIDQGQEFIGGYSDDDALVFSDDLPVIVFGDHTCNFKFVDFPFVAGADGTKLLAVSAAFIPKFVYYYFL